MNMQLNMQGAATNTHNRASDSAVTHRHMSVHIPLHGRVWPLAEGLERLSKYAHTVGKGDTLVIVRVDELEHCDQILLSDRGGAR